MASRIVEEAYALALLGRHDEALRVLEAASPGAGPEAAALDLARARLLAARGRSEDLALARQVLSPLAGGSDEHSWLARVELARVARREGRLREAAEILRDALAELRRAAHAHGEGVSPLASVLSAEVSALQEESARTEPAEEDLAPAALVRLVEFGRSLARETDPDRVLRLVLHQAVELAGAERGFVVLSTGADFEFVAAVNLDRSEVEQPAFEVSRTLIRAVLAAGRPLFLGVREIEGGQPASRSLRDLGIGSVACVPISGGHAPIGALYLDRRSRGEPFSQRALARLLELFAGQAAAAIENARAHRSVARALETAEATIRRHQLEQVRRTHYDQLVGVSDAMQAVYRALDRIVPTEMPVLILGETGTGKDVAARMIHEKGPRRGGEFVAVNCAAVPESLLESELFGHARGAFTGADRSVPGLFELAHRGTLFLDEVGDMSPRMQADLLRVLDRGEMRRLGGRETIQVDVRVVAATHRDLQEMVRHGEFRHDLYFRLGVLTLRLPPLRDRVEDIPLLVERLLPRLASGRPAPRLAPGVLERLMGYDWPGNVRELENVLRQLLVLGVDAVEELHLPPEIRDSSRRRRPGGTLRQAEAEAVRRALEEAGGSKARAARILGIDRKTLYAKLRKLGR